MSKANITAPRRVARRVGLGALGHVALIAHAEPRERIEELLCEWGLELTGFDEVDECVEHFAEDPPALAVLWVQSAIAAAAPPIEQLQQGLAQLPVVIVCVELQRWEVRAALSVGVCGVVLEEELEDALVPCMLASRAGQICVPSQHGRQIEPPALSMREKQILGLVVMGYMNSQIAERLFLAESTVKSHLSSAFGKLGVRSRNEAVNLILDSKRGLGMGILALGGERLDATSQAGR